MSSSNTDLPPYSRSASTLTPHTDKYRGSIASAVVLVGVVLISVG